MVITHAHARALGYCNRGGRQWLAQHGISWSQFVAEGIDAAQLTATGDPLALALVEFAQQHESEGSE